MTIATADEMQYNFGKYLSMVENGDEVAVTENGKITAWLLPLEKSEIPVTESAAGALTSD